MGNGKNANGKNENEKRKRILTFPQSEVCHLAQCPKLQLRTLGTRGAAPRQAASLTLIVNVADISCLQVRSRVWIPSPHVTEHGVHSPRTQLVRKKKNVTQSPGIPFDTQTDEGARTRNNQKIQKNTTKYKKEMRSIQGDRAHILILETAWRVV